MLASSLTYVSRKLLGLPSSFLISCRHTVLQGHVQASVVIWVIEEKKAVEIWSSMTANQQLNTTWAKINK